MQAEGTSILLAALLSAMEIGGLTTKLGLLLRSEPCGKVVIRARATNSQMKE